MSILHACPTKSSAFSGRERMMFKSGTILALMSCQHSPLSCSPACFLSAKRWREVQSWLLILRRLQRGRAKTEFTSVTQTNFGVGFLVIRGWVSSCFQMFPAVNTALFTAGNIRVSRLPNPTQPNPASYNRKSFFLFFFIF